MLDKLKHLSEAFGPSGFEEDVVHAIVSYCKDFNVSVDAMNNLYVSLKSNTGNKPVLMLDAHLDEVGFMVQNILPNGLLHIAPLGGWVATNVPAHTVTIKNSAHDYIQGVVVSKPPHFMSESEKNAPLQVENLLIDVGASSRDDVIHQFHIAVGDPIAPSVPFSYQTKNNICFGKAFDNRMGCLVVLETLIALSKEKDLPFDVIGAFASQEEVGTRGAHVTAQVVKPDIAIVFEGSPADDLYFSQDLAQCRLNAGAQIRHMDSSYVSHKRFIDQAKDIARKHTIPFQSAVRHKGGTNAGRIHTEGKAVPVLVLGVPCRYVHTHHNYAAIKDVHACIDLAVHIAKELQLDALTFSV